MRATRATVANEDAPARMRELLSAEGPAMLGPCVHDGLSARLIEDAGFEFAFMSGFCVSASVIGQPDTGLMSYAEVETTLRNATAAAPSLPIIADGDTGYGNAVNVKRTTKGFARAGAAGILIEDQVWPKACGHTRGRRVVERAEAVARVRAAVDASREPGGRGIVVVARTDARQAVSADEAFARAEAFADAGADVLFIDALASVEEMERFCRIAPGVPKMANMLEGGDKTPLLDGAALTAMGVRIIAYPLSLLGVTVRAMQAQLAVIRDTNGDPSAVSSSLPSFEELQSAVGFPEYYAEAARYATAADDGTAP